MPEWARASADGRSVALTLHVQPNARVSALAGRHGDALKVRIAAPAADNRANEALLALLSSALAVPPAAVRITHGRTARRKVVVVAADPRLTLQRIRGWDKDPI